jgi:hypothetical protein
MRVRVSLQTLHFLCEFRLICTIYSQNKTCQASNQSSHAHVQQKTHSNSSKNPHKIIHHEPQTFIKGWNWNQANFIYFLA